MVNNKCTIKISKSAHSTIDVVIYNAPKDIINWFILMDIWGSVGYDRFNDNGLYFELPIEMYEILPKLPFVSRNMIRVEVL